MGTLIMAGQLILALAILVSLHEWGHYIAARSFGIRVEKFFIFFDAWGTKLFSTKIGDTEWGIGWLPLGGYVKISGMIDESLDQNQLGSEPEDHEFRSKPAWQRLIVMVGGVTVNFVLGILIFSLALWHYGDTWLPAKAVNDAHGIVVTDFGAKAGFESGDKLLTVNGEKREKFRDYANPAIVLKSDSLVFEVDRNGETISIQISPELSKALLESKGQRLFSYRTVAQIDTAVTDAAIAGGFQKGDIPISVEGAPAYYYDELQTALAGHKGEKVSISVLRGADTVGLVTELDTAGSIGVGLVGPMALLSQAQTTKYGFVESFPAGTKKGLSALADNINAFGLMFKGKLNPVKSVSGPLGIAKIFGATWNWQRFWEITGMLSFILAFMNLLPIPALDGGHVLFLLVEMVRRKPLPEKLMYYFQVSGMVILFALMGFIIFIDFFNAIFN
jgi:regulator of sigma E protease